MIALEAGRSVQSAHTGFIHRSDMIPLYENLCFALALFRTHIREQVEEGKEILRRLFPFYSKGFPLYLHEYPEPSTAAHQLRCALPLHWIYKLYHQVIQPPLKEQLQQKLLDLTDLDETALSPLYQILLRALQGKNISVYTPRFSHEWGLLLLTYQLLEEKPIWILEQALECWHPKLMTYSGIAVQEYQRKEEPEMTLYDLFMAEHQGATSKRLLKPHPIHLQASLIFPFQKKLPLCYPESLMFSAHEQKEKWNAKGFHLIRFLWGSADSIYSLVCQENIPLKKVAEGFLLTYPEKLPEEKERMELPFFCSYHTDVDLTIKGRKETVFHLDEPVEIQTKEKTLKLMFSLEKGKGCFMGHISRGNRPAQMAATSSTNDFSSYDWKIGLRTIHRTKDCIIRLRIL